MSSKQGFPGREPENQDPQAGLECGRTRKREAEILTSRLISGLTVDLHISASSTCLGPGWALSQSKIAHRGLQTGPVAPRSPCTHNPGTWEAKKESCKLQASLGYIQRPCLKNSKQEAREIAPLAKCLPCLGLSSIPRSYVFKSQT